MEDGPNLQLYFGVDVERPIIKLNQVYKAFQQGSEQVTILKNLSLEIEANDFVAIVGQSGSGKSTLMNILGCLDRPTQGRYEVYGTEISQLEPDALSDLRCKHFGFIFQRYQLIGGLTALENVEIPAIYLGMPFSKRRQRATQLLAQLGLAERLKHTPGKLSGGQQQRVSIARALMNGGEVIFADEPTGALDSQSGQEVLQILKDLNQQGHTIIMVTHDPNLAKEAKRIIEMRDGQILSDTRLTPIRRGENLQSSLPTGKKLEFFSLLSGWKENYKMAIRSILHNKLRSILTMLGIIFGIASVVAMVSIGEGTVDKVLDKMGADAARTMVLYPGKTVQETSDHVPSTPFTETDLQYLKSLPYLKNVLPNLVTSGSLKRDNHILRDAAVWGCDVNCIAAKDLKLLRGTSFTQVSVDNAKQVALIDTNAEKELFPNENPLGKIFTVEGVPLEVIGVIENKSVQGGFQKVRSQIFIPYSTASIRFAGAKLAYPALSMTVKKGFSLANVKEKIEQYFYIKHGRNKDFEIFSYDDLIKKFKVVARGLELFILLVAFIALLVGGIGVMNIMLVSVTERMPEIGIRIAVGAKQKAIRQQFLIESIILCLIGGAIGVVLAFLAGFPVKLLLAKNPDTLIRFNFSFLSLLVAVFFSTIIGITFGYLPAKNASQLDPVEALSRE
ncbi:MAG: ABC transporter permease [Neisseriaceae bacterium]